MARIKFGKVTRARRKRWIKRAKGYYGTKKSSYKKAHEQVVRSMAYAFVGRKQKKRDFRKLWIVRINAAVRPYGLSYSRFMNGLKVAGVDVNRKMLSELAISNPKEFRGLVEVADKALNSGQSTIKKVEIKEAPKAEKAPVAKKPKAEKAPTVETEVKAEEVTHEEANEFLSKLESKYREHLAEEVKLDDLHEEAPKAAKKPAAKKVTEGTVEEAPKAAKKPAAKKVTKESKLSTDERSKLDGSHNIEEERYELQKYSNKLRDVAIEKKLPKKLQEVNLRDMTKKELIEYMRKIRAALQLKK